MSSRSNSTIQFINYTPPTNWTQLEITIHFTIYNELINSDFTMELLIGSDTASDNIIKGGTSGGADIRYRYKQKYRNVSGNQCIEYTKTFLLQNDDINTWTTNQYIKLRFTDDISSNTTPYYPFANSIGIGTSYSTATVQYPILSIKPTFYAIS